MKVRYPNFDFSTMRAHWAKVPEFAQNFNSFSTVPAHVEPFLVKVMTRVKKALDPVTDAELIDDITTFNKQEIQHCKYHLAFNKQLYAQGYEGMAAIEQRYKDDLEHFLENKSLRFNVAYCEGFEALGSISAQVYFEDVGDYLDGADEAAMNLWKWHLAEEFEHREVCFDSYKRLYGNGLFSYLYRLWGFIFAVIHIGNHGKRVVRYLHSVDRANMTKAELKASLAREKAVARRITIASIKRMFAVYSPFYDPGKKPVSPGMVEILASYPDTRS